MKKAIVLTIAIISVMHTEQIKALSKNLTIARAMSQAEWESVSPEGEIFSVKMPSAPTKKISVQETQAGKIPQRIYELNTKDGDYLVSVADFPQPISNTAAVFESGKDGMIKYKGYKLIGEKEITFSNHSGRELFLEAPGKPPTIFKTHTYLIGRQLIQLLVIQPKTDSYSKGTIDYYNSLANKFFSSFSIKNAD